MTKKHVPVFLNDDLVGRAEIFDLDATIKILLTDGRVMPALMDDSFRHLSIGWASVVQPKEPIDQVQMLGTLDDPPQVVVRPGWYY